MRREPGGPHPPGRSVVFAPPRWLLRRGWSGAARRSSGMRRRHSRGYARSPPQGRMGREPGHPASSRSTVTMASSSTSRPGAQRALRTRRAPVAGRAPRRPSRRAYQRRRAGRARRGRGRGLVDPLPHVRTSTCPATTATTPPSRARRAPEGHLARGPRQSTASSSRCRRFGAGRRCVRPDGAATRRGINGTTDVEVAALAAHRRLLGPSRVRCLGQPGCFARRDGTRTCSGTRSRCRSISAACSSRPGARLASHQIEERRLASEPGAARAGSCETTLVRGLGPLRRGADGRRGLQGGRPDSPSASTSAPSSG